MANDAELQQALKKFNEQIVLVKQTNLPSDVDVYTRTAYGKLSYEAEQGNALRIEEVNQHIAFLTNLMELQQAIDDPENDPVRYSSPSNNKNIQNLIKEFIPTIKQAIVKACRALEADYMTDGIDRMTTLIFLRDTIKHTTDLVKDKAKDPSEIRRLLNDARKVTENRFLKYAQKNSQFTALLGILSIATGIGFVIGGIAALAAGAVVAAIPMIAAGVMLALLGKKLLKVAEISIRNQADNSERISLRKVRLSEYGEALNRIGKTKKTFNQLTIADTVLTNSSLAYEPPPPYSLSDPLPNRNAAPIFFVSKSPNTPEPSAPPMDDLPSYESNPKLRRFSK
jgi:hypothetical protein